MQISQNIGKTVVLLHVISTDFISKLCIWCTVWSPNRSIPVFVCMVLFKEKAISVYFKSQWFIY